MAGSGEQGDEDVRLQVLEHMSHCQQNKWSGENLQIGNGFDRHFRNVTSENLVDGTRLRHRGNHTEFGQKYPGTSQ